MQTSRRKTDPRFAPNRAKSGLETPTFESEILETPDALRRLLSYWRSEGRPMAAELVAQHRPVREVVFTGMGSSVNAAYPAKYLLARHGIGVRIEPASELFYSLLNTVTPDTLVIATSQSGETIETRKVIAALQGHPHLFTVANDETSHMATCGRPFFPMCAGVETRSSSKTYTNTLVLLYLIAEQIAAAPATIADLQWDDLVEVAAFTLARSEELVRQMLDHWGTLDRLQVVARGPSLATAHEFSLIIAENTSVLVQPVDGGAFRHGLNYLAGEANKLLFLEAASPTAKLSTSLADQMARQGRRVVVLSTATNVAACEATSGHGSSLYLPLPSVGPDLAPLCEMLPLEWLILKVAQQQGRDPGKLPSKVATEE